MEDAMADLKLKRMVKDVNPVHSRKIEIKSYPTETGQVVVEGWLRDERHVEIYRHWDQRPREVGPVHGMCVRFLLGGYPITIEDIEVEMPVVPNERCNEISESVKKIIGTTITSGYSEHIRDLFGGVEGCTHLTHLMIVMGPAALHGFWTVYAQHARPVPKSLEEVEGMEYLVNSCHLWAPDGEHIRKLKESIERNANEDQS